ncbi:MAG: heme biosynthesis HemY N-terminal domain-containing protein [Aestuariivirgaceae bacterium]
MIRLFLRFAVIVALAGAIAWLADRPGVLTIDWLDYRIEAPLAVGLVVLFAAFVLCLWLYGLVRGTFRAPGTMSGFFRARRNRRGYDSLSRGIIAVGAGDLMAARRHAQIAARSLQDEPLARLLEVQTAQLSGDSKRVGHLFEAMSKTDDTKLLGLRGLFNQARQSGDFIKAGKIAAEALKTSPGLSWASNAMLAGQCAERNWAGAAATLEAQRRNRLIDQATANRKLAVVLTAQALEQEKAAPLAALQLALRAHKLDPSLVPAAVAAGRIHAAQGQARKAARVIERTFRINPHADLVRVYSYQKSGASPRERLKKADDLVQKFGGEEEGAVGAAEAAIAALDWARAKDILDGFIEERPRARLCALMAEIAEGEGDKGLAREWLARGMRAPPDPKWTADGMVSDQWQPVSPVTGELGAFQWKVPVERLAFDGAAEAPALERAEEPREVLAEIAQPAELPSEQRLHGSGAADAPEPVKATIGAKPEERRPKNEPTHRLPKIPRPDDPGTERDEEARKEGQPDDWARRLSGS